MIRLIEIEKDSEVKLKNLLDQADDLLVWRRLLDVVVHSSLKSRISESFGAVCGTAAYVGLVEDSVDLMAGIERVVDIAGLFFYVASNTLCECWSVHDRHAVVEEDKLV